MIRYVEAGYKVLGIDIDADKVDALNKGQSYIEHIPSADIHNV
jgi:UDP-N-acetyl-D-glucosamine dehydrogenase